jgi:hypothetical protein
MRSKSSGPDLEQFKHVEPYVIILKPRVKDFEVDVVDILCDEAGNLRRRVAHYVEQRDDVGAAGEVLKDLDLPLDFLLLHGLEYFDDTFLGVDDVYTLEHLRGDGLGMASGLDVRAKANNTPPSTCPDRLYEQSHSGPESPTEPEDYLHVSGVVHKHSNIGTHRIHAMTVQMSR